MKSWISFLLPDDEYKKRKMLYFFAEGAIILFFSLIAMLLYNKYVDLDAGIVLLSSIAIFVFYVSGRYILSGIEYTEIATETDYKKELSRIFIRTIGFVVIFMSLYMMIIKIPASLKEWMEIGGLLFGVSFVKFFSQFISLKSSYKKNKELL